MKYCTYGKHNVIEENFSWRDKSKGLRSSICKPCNSERNKVRYRNNSEAYSKIIKTNKAAIERNRNFIIEFLKDKFCVDCGENDLVVLDFDHLEDKKYNISKIISSGYSLKTLQKEIDKCEIVCSNCHRRRTSKRGNWFKELGK